MSKNIKNINMIELSMESGNEDVKTELSMMQRAYARLHQFTDDISYWKKFFRHFFAKIFLPPKITAY